MHQPGPKAVHFNLPGQIADEFQIEVVKTVRTFPKVIQSFRCRQIHDS